MSEVTSEIVVAQPQGAQSYHLVAVNPRQMADAQVDLSKWFQAKVGELSNELTDVSTALQHAVENKWQTATLKRQVERCKQRLKFYDKCLRATDAGFAIIPNIPVDVFAVRVARQAPTGHAEIEAPNDWQRPRLPDQASDKLAAGEGRYVSNENQENRGRRTELHDSKEVLVKYVTAIDFGEVEFPMIAAAPQVMDATGKAMLLQIFDEIGVSPQRTLRGDPLIIGRIVMAKQGWQEKVLSFLIAWHLDLRTL